MHTTGLSTDELSNAEGNDFRSIPIEIPSFFQDKNEVLEFVELFLSGRKDDKINFINALYDLHCALVFHLVNQNLKDGPRLQDKYAESYRLFRKLLTDLPASKEWQEKLFRYLPEKTWPRQYLDYGEELVKEWRSIVSLKGKINNQQIRALVEEDSLSDEDRLAIYAGSKIRDRAERIRTQINHILRDKWVDPAKLSASQSLAGLLYGIRKSLYLEHEEQLALDGMKRRVKLSTTTTTTSFPAAGLGASRDENYLAERLRSAESCWGGLYFPRIWLAFLLLSKPAGAAGLSTYSTLPAPGGLPRGERRGERLTPAKRKSEAVEADPTACDRKREEDEFLEADADLSSLVVDEEPLLAAALQAEPSQPPAQQSPGQSSQPATAATATVLQKEQRLDKAIAALEKQREIFLARGDGPRLSAVEEKLLRCLAYYEKEGDLVLSELLTGRQLLLLSRR
jgi:hypothetical protein